jgi:hypothetical protein
MDTLFGSVGFAQADAERMREISREVGLAKYGDAGAGGGSVEIIDEKGGVHHKDSGDL